MDDSCAVCAEALEWVAYGPCGHKEVCSTCVARLRFICNDHRCCICKTESNVVFVTKALGDYTRMISDFNVLPSDVKEGRIGSFWYHEDTQAYFDDLDHYKMVKAMCRLSCSICDKMEEQPSDGPKRRGRFKNVEQLKGHLFHQHRLVMCSLCLEGRKVFICEQKLYTRAQLNQHINTGDSEVDGTESERGGFMGHPLCEFCRTPFYGDNELYTHMSTEHYTCHLCQRQHPGQYEYYKNYDDLEIHFRRDHFLCEDEACLAKKFVVFLSEAEMKRHNTLEHGGRMSRSKRSAALQIPTSFRYRRSNEQDGRRGRGRTFRRDSHDDTQMSMAIQASLETAVADEQLQEPPSSITQVFSDHGPTSETFPIIQPFESLSTTDSEASSRYLQALSQNSRNKPLEVSSFPPLFAAPPTSSQQNLKHDSEASVSNNTMAARLRRQQKKNANVIGSSQGWPTANHLSSSSGITPTHIRPTMSGATGSVPGFDPNKLATEGVPSRSGYLGSLQVRPAGLHETSSNVSFRNAAGTGRISHSTSAPNLVQSGSFDSSISDFPPVSAVQTCKLASSMSPMLKVEDVQSANKSLVERIRTALNFDEDKYSAFKGISADYRQGLIDAEMYLVYVDQYGLSHLLLELARLCPDTQRQKTLIDTYNANMVSNGLQRNGLFSGNLRLKDDRSSKGEGKGKGKGKDAVVDVENGGLKDTLADSLMSTVRKLQTSYTPAEEEVEVLLKDDYRAAKGKVKVAVDEYASELNSHGQLSRLKGQIDSQPVGGGSNQNLGDGRSKSKKKTSKFNRIRLGDGSAAAIFDPQNYNHDPDPVPNSNSVEPASEGQGLPARGVWRNGGGQRLLTTSLKDQPKK